MPVPLPNIVQAEFFLVGVRSGDSLEVAMTEMRDRIANGLQDVLGGMDPDEVKTGIKACVRFYDLSGRITALVEREHVLDVAHREANEQFRTSAGLRRMFWRWKLAWLLTKIIDIRDRQHVYTTQEFEAKLNSGQQVAVERQDHTYRIIRKDEAHELVEAIKASHNVWIFLFKYNDLLADKNKLVLSSVF